MGLFSALFGKKKNGDKPEAGAATATATPPRLEYHPSTNSGTVDDAADVAPLTPPAKLGWLGGLKQKLKGEVDDYVNEKTEEARVMAEQFRAETLSQVKSQAFELLDITEKRIDKKLVEIEKMLDERLQQELKMRLRAMIWTLAFVLLMAIVSIIYVWAKHEAGLDKTPAAQTR